MIRESGTGKELVIRAVYLHGIRLDKNVSIINCVAIPVDVRIIAATNRDLKSAKKNYPGAFQEGSLFPPQGHNH